MANKNKLRFCVVGCGNVALKYGIDAIVSSENAELIVCVDHGLSKKKIVQAKYNCAFELRFSEALRHYEFDAVYIATPTAFHKEVALEAAERGIHILCEKSLASNFVDAEEMVNAAYENDVALFEGFMYQFHLQHAFVKRLLAEDKIGEVNQINAHFSYPARPNGDFRYNKRKGGGGLLDAGAYPVHLARMFFRDEPIRIKSSLYENKSVDIRGSMLLTFKDNRVAQLNYAMNSFYRNKYELFGSKGVITVERAFSVSPDYIPIVTVENANGIKSYELESDNHFVKEIDYFSENHKSKSIRAKWRKEALYQSLSIESIFYNQKTNM